MDLIESVINEFRDAEPWRKARIVSELEDSLADSRVASFFATIIANPDEYDLARIEALKILEFSPAQVGADRVALAGSLVAGLSDNDDILVQQWAARAAKAFVDMPHVVDALCALISDATTDLDVRHNCLTALERRCDPKVVEALEAASADPTFGRFAAQSLARRRE